MQPKPILGNPLRRPTQDVRDLFNPQRPEEGVPMAPDVETAFGPERLLRDRPKKAEKKK